MPIYPRKPASAGFLLSLNSQSVQYNRQHAIVTIKSLKHKSGYDMSKSAPHHDCRDLVNKLGGHDSRIKVLEEFRNEMTVKLQSIESLQERTFREMTSARSESSTKIDSIAAGQLTMQLDMATERGRKEQSGKTLYLVIALMGILPTIAALFAAFKIVAHQ